MNLPTRNNFDEADFSSSVDWDISALLASPGQLVASLLEQHAALTRRKRMIDKYKSGYRGFIKNMLLMGVAGSGKTTVQESIGLYALGQGGLSVY